MMRLEGKVSQVPEVLISGIKKFEVYLVDRGEPLNCFRQESDSLIIPSEQKDRLEGDDASLEVKHVCMNQGGGVVVKGR